MKKQSLGEEADSYEMESADDMTENEVEEMKTSESTGELEKD